MYLTCKILSDFFVLFCFVAAMDRKEKDKGNPAFKDSRNLFF